jgi:predicted PurR-regulated permease PerM
MQTKIIERYFFFGLLLATLIFTFLIFRPFWIVLVLGASFAIVLYPVYLWLKKIRLPSWLSSLFTVILFSIIVCGPLLGIGAMVFNQSQNLYNKVASSGSTEPFLDTVNAKVNRVLPDGINFDINQKVTAFVSYVSNNIANIFTNTLSAFFSFILMLLIIFFLLKNGEKSKKALVRISPLSLENNEKLIDGFTEGVNGIMRGSLLMALFQGVYVGFGFFIFGIPNAALWGVVAGICSLIPPIGATLVSLPGIIFLFATGHTVPAVLLFVWAIVLLAIIDTVVRPILVGEKIDVPPILILFSILGGLTLLGPVGILIGPLSISLLHTLILIYRNEFKD